MTENESTLKIKDISNSLLNETLNQNQIEKNINDIHAIFQKETDITGFDSKVEHLAAVETAKGKALGLNHAAKCLLDYNRTVKFLKAVVTAIKEKQKEQPGKQINIFYAGCGPYAPFVTLIAPLFDSKEIQFSLLEINNDSLESAKKLINALELSDYIKDYYLEDAVTFKIPNPETFDILYSETLDALLYRECYVPILFNMLPQFKENITLIPENVLISFKLTAHSERDSSDYTEYAIDTVLNVRDAVSAHEQGKPIPEQLPVKSVKLEGMERYKTAIIDTEVHVYKDIWLTRGESSLTLPLEMELEQPFDYSTMIFTYQMAPDIELKFKLE